MENMTLIHLLSDVDGRSSSQHIAFTFSGSENLAFGNIQRKARGIELIPRAHQDITTTMSYRNLNGNLLETIVDVFSNAEE